MRDSLLESSCGMMKLMSLLLLCHTTVTEHCPILICETETVTLPDPDPSDAGYFPGTCSLLPDSELIKKLSIVPGQFRTVGQ